MSLRVPPIRPAAVVTLPLSVLLPAHLKSGAHQLEAIVDPSRQIRQYSKVENISRVPIPVIGSVPQEPMVCMTLRWRGLDSKYRFRAEVSFGLGLPDSHRVPWPVASAATPGHHPARSPSLGARRRRRLPRPAPPPPRRRAAVHAGGDRGQICLGRTVRRGRHRPALAPHLAKSDRDVDPGSGAVTDEYVAAFRTLWTEKKPAIDGRYVH